MAKTRSDSIAAAVSAALAVAEGPLEPPAHIELRAGDRPFWDAVVSARARDTWNDVDLASAANLARAQADIERLTTEISVEGDMLTNRNGTQIINPKHQLLEVLSRRATSIARAIHVHAEATQGRSEDAGKKLGTERKAKAAASKVTAADADAGSLIPGLRAVK